MGSGVLRSSAQWGPGRPWLGRAPGGAARPPAPVRSARGHVSRRGEQVGHHVTPRTSPAAPLPPSTWSWPSPGLGAGADLRLCPFERGAGSGVGSPGARVGSTGRGRAAAVPQQGGKDLQPHQCGPGHGHQPALPPATPSSHLSDTSCSSSLFSSNFSFPLLYPSLLFPQPQYCHTATQPWGCTRDAQRHC